MDELVTFDGGPFDGQQRWVERERTVITIEWEDEDVARDYHGTEVYVTLKGSAQYRRVGGRFVHVPAAWRPSDE